MKCNAQVMQQKLRDLFSRVIIYIPGAMLANEETHGVWQRKDRAAKRAHFPTQSIPILMRKAVVNK